MSRRERFARRLKNPFPCRTPFSTLAHIVRQRRAFFFSIQRKKKDNFVTNSEKYNIFYKFFTASLRLFYKNFRPAPDRFPTFFSRSLFLFPKFRRYKDR